jgi:16S rRNA G966 N2-methylase RsmD
MIITTAGRANEEMTRRAMEYAKELKLPFIPRNKCSVSKLINTYLDDVIVIGKEGNVLHLAEDSDSEPIFFHPNSAMFRIKRLLKKNCDPLLDATQLSEGMSFLDCTLGLGSDSIVASFLVGRTGSVTALEGNKALSFLVKEGLKQWNSGSPTIDAAMRKINVINEKYETYLKNLATKSVDVIYFDPMFEEEIANSDGIKGVKKLAIYSTITESCMHEAKRVARKRIVLKDHWQSNRFSQLGFTVLKRQTSKVHFGYIDIK